MLAKEDDRASDSAGYGTDDNADYGEVAAATVNLDDIPDDPCYDYGYTDGELYETSAFLALDAAHDGDERG